MKQPVFTFLTLLFLFALIGCGGTPPTPVEASPETQATAFTSTLVAKHSGKCLDIRGGSFANGSPMEQESCSSSEAPNFKFIPVPGKSATYSVKNTRTGKCLDIFRAKIANSVPLIQYRCGQGANQHFKLVDAGNSYYQLKAGHSGKCVDVRYLLKKDGAEVVQYSCQGGDKRYQNGNQLWKLSKNGSPTDGGDTPSGGDVPSGGGTPEPGAYYVAPGGNDRANGAIGAPFRTVQKCASVAKAGESCILRAGTYRETVKPANSGRSGSPVTFKPYPGETVTISGADRVTEWQKHSGNIYKAPVDWDLGIGKNQVFVDGKMMTEARWPNRGSDPSRPAFEHLDRVSGGGSSWTLYDSALPGGLSGAYINLGLGLEINDLKGHAWVTQTARVTSSSGGRVSVSAESRLEYPPVPATQYFVWGKRSLLDSPGEWFYDSGEKALYLWLPKSDSPANHRVEVKRRQLTFDLRGRSNIEISGLKLFGANLLSDGNSRDLLLEKLDARYLSHYLNIPRNPWSFGVKDSGIVLQGRDHTMRDSRVAYSAGNGVLLHGSGHKVENSVIHDVAYAGGDAAAVNMSCKQCGGTSSGHLVSQNTLYNAGRSVLLHRKTQRSRIVYNDMSRAGLQMDDLGVTYTHGTDGGGTEIAYNLIHDNEAEHLGLGIYLDEGSSNFRIHHNVVWNVKDALRFNLPSRNNMAFNNTLWAQRDSISYWGRRGNEDMSGTRAYNNLVSGRIKLNYGAVEGANLKTADPRFVSVERDDYRLRSDSPAIDRGRVLEGHTGSYTGSAPDVGAYEYNGQSWRVGSNLTGQDGSLLALHD